MARSDTSSPRRPRARIAILLLAGSALLATGCNDTGEAQASVSPAFRRNVIPELDRGIPRAARSSDGQSGVVGGLGYEDPWASRCEYDPEDGEMKISGALTNFGRTATSFRVEARITPKGKTRVTEAITVGPLKPNQHRPYDFTVTVPDAASYRCSIDIS